MQHHRFHSFALASVAFSLALGASACAVQAQPDPTPTASESTEKQAPAAPLTPEEAQRRALDPLLEKMDVEVHVEAARLPKLELAAPALLDPKAPKESQVILWHVPDLTVVEDDRPAWKWDPRIGWYQAYAVGFTVKNIGTLTSGSFRVSILNGSKSRGFDIASLAPGASQYVELTHEVDCGAKAVIIVNPFNAAWESNYDNNVATVPGICNF